MALEATQAHLGGVKYFGPATGKTRLSCLWRRPIRMHCN